MTSDTDSNYAVARHPIYHVDGDVFGYELLYRTVGGGNVATFPSDAEATLAVLANGIHAISQDIPRDKRIFINFSTVILAAGHHRFLDPARYVLEVLEHVTCDAAFVELVRGIREAGYVLALDDYVGQASFDPILPYMTFIKLDLLALRDDPVHMAAVADRCLALGKTVLAEKVETAADIAWCRDRGIPLAQGFYYSRPQVVTTKILEPNQAIKLNLLAEVGRAELDVRRIREIIGSDVSLTYKLLRYVNTASFYRGQPIESLDFAISRLGRNALASWVAVNMLSNLGSTAHDRELAFASAVRGRFLALADARRAKPCHQGDSICLLGLLSLLDAMLAMPMAKALTGITIDSHIRDALNGQASPCAPCLALAGCYDNGGAQAAAAMKTFGIRPDDASDSYFAALAWAADMFRS
ncbi:EAL domain-containing protein [Desulfovibrio aerotolerans]|uniref:EAL domain-containing protein n=1 Tax=Solidesulfovibrio aerotolerans TaxID=295255 RepID=A0A7C9IK71_9BACT|nr:EAL domain-containing protein [Solidesulfovibrio aerotolerans]MYL82701.1 EAL domain-containing protein [Solidesulfovibrio aerotolerans]